MIKIIEKGKETFELRCCQCGCKFSYELSDVGTILPGQVKCPCCEHYMWHPTQDKGNEEVEK